MQVSGPEELEDAGSLFMPDRFSESASRPLRLQQEAKVRLGSNVAFNHVIALLLPENNQQLVMQE